MTKTSTVICFGAYDALNYKQDETPTCNVTLQSFSKITDLKLHDQADAQPYASFEPDFWLLDGSFKIKPASDTNVHVGLMTTVMSNETGAFITAPVLTCTFANVHNTDGIILRFDDRTGDYANSITVAFYNASNALIRIDNYAPTNTEFATNQAVTAFKKIVITFNSTNRPYRFLRLLDIDFANATYFGKSEIKSCDAIEQIDPASLTVPFCTLDFTLFTDDPQFSIIEPAGEYTLLQYKQPLFVYEIIDGVCVFVGNFYLDTWENLTNSEIALHAVDIIGILDKITCEGFQLNSLQSATTLLTNLLSPLGVSFELESPLNTAMVVGRVDSMSYRDTLKQICFYLGGYATSSRSNIIKIKPLLMAEDIVTPDYTILNAEIGIKPSLSLKTLITGVEIVGLNAVADVSAPVKVFESVLTAGTHTIYFNRIIIIHASYMPTISGATATTWYYNRAIINVAAGGTVTVNGYVIDDRTTLAGVYNPDTSIPQNVIRVSDATLISIAGAPGAVQRQYDYSQQRHLYKPRLYIPSVKVGDSVYIDIPYAGRQMAGIVEKMTTNLLNGFISDVEIVGVVKPL